MDRETYKTFVARIKSQLKYEVEKKVALTRHRVEYKNSSRGVDPELERMYKLNRIDSDRRNVKHEIRHLHLLYGYIRGQDVKKIENHSKKAVSTGEITAWLDTFKEELKLDIEISKEDINSWLSGERSPFARQKLPTDATEKAA